MEITLNSLLAVCGGISCIAAAVNWIAKAVKASGGYLSCIVCIK
jgi:hypothetical protein